MKKRVEIYLKEIMWTQWVGFDYISRQLPTFDSTQMQKDIKVLFNDRNFQSTTFRSIITQKPYRFN